MLQSILHNGNGDSSEPTNNSLATTLGSTSTNSSNALTSRAPGSQLQHQKQNSLIINPTTNGISVCSNNSNSSHTLNNSITPFGPDFTSDLTKQVGYFCIYIFESSSPTHTDFSIANLFNIFAVNGD